MARPGPAGASDPPREPDYAFLAQKGGMAGVDVAAVRAVVRQMSAGSAHEANERRKAEEHAKRERELARRRAELERDKTALARCRREVDAAVVALEAKRSLARTWFHVDMDSFYASCAEREDPSLKGTAFAVGGIGMISTASYEARKFGVRSAMPGFIALQLCPHLRFVRSDFALYNKVADTVRSVLRQYGELVVRGLDEASLDVTQYVAKHWPNAQRSSDTLNALADRIRAEVEEASKGPTCSVGVAATPELAKIASDLRKPNGQYIVPFERDELVSWIRAQPTRKVSGIGKVTEALLKGLAIETVEDLWQHRVLLHGILTPSASSFLLRTSLAISSADVADDERAAARDDARKSCSVERTFTSMSDQRALSRKLIEIALTLERHVQELGLRGKQLTLKIKLSSFELRSRQVALPAFTDSSDDIIPAALKLLKAELPLSARLLGLRLSCWEHENEPLGRDILALFKQHADGADDSNGPAAAAVAAPAPPPLPSPAPAPSPARWSCVACTLENAPSSLRCDACGTLRGGALPPASTLAAYRQPKRPLAALFGGAPPSKRPPR